MDSGLGAGWAIPGSGFPGTPTWHLRQAPPEIRGQASSSNLIIEGLLRETAKDSILLTRWNLWGSHFWYKTCCQQLPEVGPSWGGLKFILYPHRAWPELSPPEPQHCTWPWVLAPCSPSKITGQRVPSCPVSDYVVIKRSLTEICDFIVTWASRRGGCIWDRWDPSCFSMTCLLAKDFQELLHHAAFLCFHSLCGFSVCRISN